MKRRTLLQAGLPLAWGCLPGLGHALGDTPFGSTIVASFGKMPAGKNVRKVFAAGPPAGVLVAALAPDKLLGWPMQLSDSARALLGPALQKHAFIGRLAGRGSTMSIETLLQLQPDLILDAGTADATYISGVQRVSEQTGLPTVLVQGRIADHAAQLREVGALLGVPERAARLAAFADSALQLAAQVRADAPPARRPRVYYGRGIDGLETGLEGSINLELIEFCGGRNVAAAAGKGSLTRVSLEQILAWDPEVIVTQQPEFAQRVLSDPLWKSLPAVRARRVHCAPSLPFGWLDGPPGLNRLIGIPWLVEKLHPQPPALRAFGPLPQAVRQFYQQFYGKDLAAAEVGKLLDAGP